MDGKRRTEVLAEANEEEVIAWADEVERQAAIQVVKTPEMGLVMMRVQESVEKQQFHLGELLMTECTVSVEGELGYGAVLGNKKELAKSIAVIDAAYRSPSPQWAEYKSRFDDWLQKEQKRLHENKLKQFHLMERSRVDFEVMDE